ncbi:UNVERIFIED_ORG: hypothetical protein FHR35_001795 [Microbispora rosea subsp. rosea]
MTHRIFRSGEDCDYGYACLARAKNAESRAGDRDRDRVAETLRAAVGEGRITLDEPTERLGRVHNTSPVPPDPDGAVLRLSGHIGGDIWVRHHRIP